VAAGADAATVEREVAKLPAAQRTPEIELQEDDEGVAAVLFLALGTQWRSAGQAGILTGLDYAAIEPAARMLGLGLVPQTFLDLRHMEAVALKTMAAARK
jgi:hypothetical protein